MSASTLGVGPYYHAEFRTPTMLESYISNKPLGFRGPRMDISGVITKTIRIKIDYCIIIIIRNRFKITAIVLFLIYDYTCRNV